MIPRPVTPKTALAERQRILDEQNALLNGLNINGVDNENNTKSKYGQTSLSASTSKTSTPVPRLTKSKSSANASSSGKASSRVKQESATSAAHVVRSERQRNKKARMEQASQAAGDAAVSTITAPPPSPAVNGHVSGNGDPVNGSAGTGRSSSVKIKIRPRVVSSASANNATPPPVLALGPPAQSPPLKGSSPHEVLKLHSPQPNFENIDPSPQLEENSKNDEVSAHVNGKTGNVQFAPVGIDSSDPPLWTRVPLPPPPSAKVVKPRAENEESRNGDMTTSLDMAAEQARDARFRRTSKPRSRRDQEENRLGLPQRDSKQIEDNGEITEPPPKKSRHRQRSGDSNLSNGGLHDALSGGLPNTGRTIYSQR